MVKLRNANYCNLKLFLIFLVIYGHLMEPAIWESEILMTQYRWIYLVHMPLFSFLSGLFLNCRETCKSQLKRTIPLYAVCQIVAVFISGGEVSPWIPFWHLWYLLSYSIWTGFAWIWFRFCKGKGKIIILLCSVLLGCIAGLIPCIGRALSLSRTFVFLPYFFAGVICEPGYHWKKLRPWGLLALGIVLGVMVNGGNGLPVTFLYHAAPYVDAQNGVQLRLVCYLLGALLCLFLLSFAPTKRFSFTKAGANTMPVYLLHAPIVLYIRELNIPWPFHIFIAVFLVYAIYKFFQWHSNLYGIVSGERRDNRWLPFKKFMKNTLSRYTDSCYP